MKVVLPLWLLLLIDDNLAIAFGMMNDNGDVAGTVG